MKNVCVYWFLLLNFEVNFITVHVFALSYKGKSSSYFFACCCQAVFLILPFCPLQVNFCLWDCGLFFLWIIEITRVKTQFLLHYRLRAGSELSKGAEEVCKKELIPGMQGERLQGSEPPPARVPWVTLQQLCPRQCCGVSAPYVQPGTHKKHLPTATAKGRGAVWDSISCLGIVSNETSDSSLHQNKVF